MVMAIVPVVVALVQGAKAVGMSGKYAPIASIVIAIGLIILTGPASWSAVILQGIVAGLSASGLYSGGKAISAESQEG